MGSGHPIESIMKTTMDSLKSMVDVNTVVGDPVETGDGTVIVPVSKVSFGFVAGGGDDTGFYEGAQKQGGEDGQVGNTGFTGGSGAGVSVKPVGFLVVGGDKVRFLPVDSRVIVDRVLDMAPELLDRFADILDGITGRATVVTGEDQREDY
jgi:sporulation protein YtfJ